MSVHRDQPHPKCPRCKTALDTLGKGRLACGHGGRDGDGCGVLVREDSLREAIVEGTATTPDTFVLELKPEKDPGVVIECPECGMPMKHHELYTMHVDRCSEHGIWFDRDELAHVLATAKPYDKNAGDRLRLAVGGLAGAGLIALQIVRFIWF